MAKTYTLLMWEEVPEDTKLFLLPNDTIDDEALQVLRKANGKYINHVDATKADLDALNCIGNAVCSTAEYLDDDHPVGSKWALRWTGCLHEEGTGPIEGKTITAVFCAGILV